MYLEHFRFYLTIGHKSQNVSGVTVIAKNYVCNDSRINARRTWELKTSKTRST